MEQRRCERSRRGFVLMLLECDCFLTQSGKHRMVDIVLRVLAQTTRETDITGWYRDGSVVGIIFTEIPTEECKSTAGLLSSKISRSLADVLTGEELARIDLSCLLFPEDWVGKKDDPGGGHVLYPDLLRYTDRKKVSLWAKRSMDFLGSFLAIVILSPVFGAVALAVRATSAGPVFFRQRRVGQYAEEFTFLKFRSMYQTNDSTIHQEFVKRLISGEPGASTGQGTANATNGKKDQAPVYKLTHDPRITPVGRFLRRTSLDELPQLFNVLMGDMSLVGPRPPIRYEVDCYDAWHRRRLLTVQPGITGLWQVQGRSRMKFDDMVRLDLQYARSWSLGMDVKILLQTPRAVVTGSGAY